MLSQKEVINENKNDRAIRDKTPYYVSRNELGDDTQAGSSRF